MIAYKIFSIIGIMTVAYFVSEAAQSSAKRLSEENRHPFLVKVLSVIYVFSSMLSLFVGLIIHLYLDSKENSYKYDAEKKIGDMCQEHASEIADLKAQNLHLQSQVKSLEKQLAEKSPEESSGEAVYTMESNDGMLVRVPESKLDSWQAAQDGHSNNSRLDELWPQIKERALQKLRDMAASSDRDDASSH